MNTKLLFALVILVIVAIGIYFYYNPSDNVGIGEGIEVVTSEIVPEDKQIEVANAELNAKYDANLVLNDASREEFTLTLYLSNISNNEAPDILSSDIYAFISSNGKNIFGSSTVQKYSEKIDKIAVSSVMDYSGSMENNFSQMQNAVKSFVDNFSGNDLVEIIKFGSDIEQLTNFTSDKNYLSNQIFTNSQMRGETSLYAAINMGLNDFSSIDKYYSKAVVAFADGQDNNSEQYNVTYERVLEQSNKLKIPIFTVGLQDPRLTNSILMYSKTHLVGLQTKAEVSTT